MGCGSADHPPHVFVWRTSDERVCLLLLFKTIRCIASHKQTSRRLSTSSRGTRRLSTRCSSTPKAISLAVVRQTGQCMSKKPPPHFSFHTIIEDVLFFPQQTYTTDILENCRHEVPHISGVLAVQYKKVTGNGGLVRLGLRDRGGGQQHCRRKQRTAFGGWKRIKTKTIMVPKKGSENKKTRGNLASLDQPQNAGLSSLSPYVPPTPFSPILFFFSVFTCFCSTVFNGISMSCTYRGGCLHENIFLFTLWYR